MKLRGRTAAALAPMLLAAGCFAGDPSASSPAPTSSPGVGALPSPSAQRTQNVPSRGPLPSMVVVTLPPSTSSPEPRTTPNPTAVVDPKLLAMLPMSIAGHAIETFSGRASDWPGGTDMCGAFCPGELQATAKAAGADPDDVTWAVAYGDFDGEGAVLIKAIRVPGAESDLIDAWVSAATYLIFPEPTEIEVDGRPVTVIHQPSFGDTVPPVYAVVRGNVLFIVQAGPAPADPLEPDGLTLEAITLLP